MDRWNLDILYTGIDTPEFTSDSKALSSAIEELSALADRIPELSAIELVKSYINIREKVEHLGNKLIIYANLRYSQNTRDSEAMGALSRLLSELSKMAAPETLLSSAIANLPELCDIANSPELSEYSYFLLNIKRDNKYLLSDKEESLLAKLDISGAGAWSDLQSSLTSGVSVDYDGKTVTLSEIRSLAYDADPAVRRAAYEAELCAYEKIKESVAFALNSIKHQVLCECELRGYESPLAKTLATSRMKRETLDALLLAMQDYIPAFRKYLRAKAKYLGHKGALPWYDLFAPVGKNDKKYTVEQARDYLLSVFERFDKDLHDMVKEAFDNEWIDFFPRDGKVGGAFDCGVPSAKVSRVLTNFTGSFSDVVTLAHELGHAFHDRQVFSHSVLTQGYSMPVAETASTFNEVLVMNTAIKDASDRDTRLALIESQLMDACQIICDIYSRFLFEGSVFENRPNEFMSADRMCELMLDAQRQSYGDGLSDEFMHPYMWLCKGHYYSGSLSFYNFPYAFGGLFARGLFAKYESEGAAFVPVYKKLLYTTSIADIEDTAKIAGIDLTKKEFWASGLEIIKSEIEEFCSLVGYSE